MKGKVGRRDQARKFWLVCSMGLVGLTMESLSGSAMRTDTPSERRIGSELDGQDCCRQGFDVET